MKTYKTEETALKRQEYLAREFGIFSGAQRVGNRWRLLFDPDLTRPHGARARIRDDLMEYAEDAEGYDWIGDRL